MRQTGGRQAFKLRRGGAGKTPSRRKKILPQRGKGGGQKSGGRAPAPKKCGENPIGGNPKIFAIRQCRFLFAEKSRPLRPQKSARGGVYFNPARKFARVQTSPAAPSGAEGNGARQHPKLSPKNCGRSLLRRKNFRRFSKRFPLSERKILHKKPHSEVSATNAGKIKTLANNRNPLTSRDRDGTPRFAASSGAAAHAQTAGGVSPAARQTSKPAAGRFCPLRGSPPPRPFRRRVSAFRKPRS